MKKSIFIAALGVAATVASSYGQGLIIFTSYSSNDGAGTTTSLFGPNTAVADGFTADLYYFLGTTTDPVNNGSASSIFSAPTGMTGAGVVGITYSGGFFNDSNPVQIPGYTTGPITFEVVAFNGSNYANSTTRGRSGAFTMSAITTVAGAAGGQPLTALGDGADNFAPMFVATSVPEPTTLALAGLGGLASLVALRRKKA